MKAILVIDIPEEFDKALADGRCGIEYQVFTTYEDSELIYENEYQTLKPAPSEYAMSRNDSIDDCAWFYGYNKCVREVVGDDSH
jgi:hypothetical protein